MTKKREIAFVLNQHLDHLRTRWLAHADEADTYKNLYEEANLFIQRAIQRLPEDHALHPFNYNALFSDDYARQLAAEFEAQDAESKFDPELDESVGVEEVPVSDNVNLEHLQHSRHHIGLESLSEEVPGQDEDGRLFNISDYNKQVMKDAETATTGKVLKKEEENDTSGSA
jgi:hypothetical protein